MFQGHDLGLSGGRTSAENSNALQSERVFMGFWIILIGVVLSVALLFAAYRLQSRLALGGVVVVVIATIVGVILDEMIVTEKEKIRSAIYALAEVVGRNDVEGAVGMVSPTATQCIDDIRSEMPQYAFQYCLVRRIEPFEIQEVGGQQEATVEFRVLVDVRAPQIGYGGRVLRVVELNLRKEGEQWLFYDYDHWGPPEFEAFTGKAPTRDELYPGSE